MCSMPSIFHSLNEHAFAAGQQLGLSRERNVHKLINKPGDLLEIAQIARAPHNGALAKRLEPGHRQVPRERTVRACTDHHFIQGRKIMNRLSPHCFTCHPPIPKPDPCPPPVLWIFLKLWSLWRDGSESWAALRHPTCSGIQVDHSWCYLDCQYSPLNGLSMPTRSSRRKSTRLQLPLFHGPSPSPS